MPQLAILGRRHVNALQVAAPQGSRKFAAVQTISFHSLSWCSRHHRRRHYQTSMARGRQLIVESKPGRPSFVNKRQSLPGKVLPYIVQQLSRTIWQPQRLHQSLVIGESGGDAMMVDIEPREHVVVARHKYLSVN